MAEEHSGAGEFRGSGEFVARIADVVSALDRLEIGQTAIGTRLSSVEAGEMSLRPGLQGELHQMQMLLAGAQTTLRVDLMARMDRLQDAMSAIRDDITVNMGAADAVQRATTTPGPTFARSAIRCRFYGSN